MITSNTLTVDAVLITLLMEDGSPCPVFAVDRRAMRTSTDAPLAPNDEHTGLSVDEIATAHWGWLAADGCIEVLRLDQSVKRRLANHLATSGIDVIEIDDNFLPGQSPMPAPFARLGVMRELD